MKKTDREIPFVVKLQRNSNKAIESLLKKKKNSIKYRKNIEKLYWCEKLGKLQEKKLKSCNRIKKIVQIKKLHQIVLNQLESVQTSGNSVKKSVKKTS